MKEEGAQNGFSLLEALVVLAIIGLLAAAAVVQVNKAWQKSRLEAAASDVQSYLQTAYTYMVNNRAPVFVVMTLSGSTPTALGVFQNADGSGTQYGTTYTFPNFLSVTQTNWPDGAGGVKVLECDNGGRTLDINSSKLIQNSAALAITHADMVSGKLSPKIVYTVQLSALWKAQLTKAVS